MTSYLEIKQCLRDILAIDADIDETCDIVWQVSSYFDEDIKIIFNNHDIKAAYDDMQNYTLDKLEISTATYREVALQFFRPYERSIAELECINDQINGITYSVGPASSTYCMFLLDAVFQDSKVNGRKSYIDLRHKSRLMLRRNRGDIERNDSMELLPELFRAYTLKVYSAKTVAIAQLRNYATSFEFQFMYKKNMAISEYTNIQDMYLIGNSVLRYSSENIDSPPQRVYNSAVLDYYTRSSAALFQILCDLTYDIEVSDGRNYSVPLYIRDTELCKMIHNTCIDFTEEDAMLYKNYFSINDRVLHGSEIEEELEVLQEIGLVNLSEENDESDIYSIENIEFTVSTENKKFKVLPLYDEKQEVYYVVTGCMTFTKIGLELYKALKKQIVKPLFFLKLVESFMNYGEFQK